MEIREQVTVKEVVPDADGVTVVTDQGEFRAQIVVGADGSNGVTRRCILPREAVGTARVLDLISSPSPRASRGTPGTSPLRSRDSRRAAGAFTTRT